jgi:hypothetical protein
LTIPMFEWPKANEGEIIVSLPFKIFWETSIPLAAVIGLLMWLISKCDERDWENLLTFPSRHLSKPRTPGHRPGNNASSSTFSQLASHPKAPSSNAQGDVVASLPLGTPSSGPAGKDKAIANGNGGAIQRWFIHRNRSRSHKQAIDIESVQVEPQQEEPVEVDLGKQDGLQ